MTVIAVFNQKGGVGKTTTTLNIAGALAKNGIDCLTLDLDPQGHLTQTYNIDTESAQSLYGFYRDQTPLTELIRTLPNGQHVIPSHVELAKVDTLFGKGPSITHRLKNGIRDEMLDQGGSPILIDCCPMIGVLSINAILAAERVLVPISTDYLSMKGAWQLENTLKALEHVVKKRIERRFVVTRYDRRRRLSEDVVHQLQARFGKEVCFTRIRENSALTESPHFNKDIFEYAPSSNGARDYAFLLDELIESGFLTIPALH